MALVKRVPAPVKGKLPSQQANISDSRGMADDMAKVKNNIKAGPWKVLKKEFDDLEKEFDENLARVYRHASHKSGVEACMRLIDENHGQVEVVNIFLKSLCNKNLLIVAKSSS
jgi:hypothetical protein